MDFGPYGLGRQADWRKCKECGERKGITSFPRHARSPEGRRLVCKTCISNNEDPGAKRRRYARQRYPT